MSQKDDASANQFRIDWREAFGEHPPLGWELRHQLATRWTRFHALPGSKRYAENKEESAEIVRRANALLSACFEPSSSIWVVIVRYEAMPKTQQQISSYGLDFNPVLEWIDPREAPEDQSPYFFWATRSLSIEGRFDALFTAIAEEQDRAIFFASGTEPVLAPYDGGFDVVAPSEEVLRNLESRFGSWMSDRQDGL